jgi:hypothetical protein
MFGETPYLVGSAMTRADFRDVDVRLILDDSIFDGHFADERFRNGLNLAVSLWGESVTRLPIDFQIQRRTDANAEFPAANRRRPLGAHEVITEMHTAYRTVWPT